MHIRYFKKNHSWSVVRFLFLFCLTFFLIGIFSGNRNAYAATQQTVYVGDSRTVGIHNAVSDQYVSDDLDSAEGSDVWIGKVSMGYDWFVDTAMSEAKPYLEEGNTDLIILMGCNDMESTELADSYADYLEENESWLNANGNRVYFVSVNPVGHKDGNDGTTYGNFSNSGTCEPFNEALKNTLPDYVTFIDTYSYLLENGYTTVDGLHYNNSTYRSLYSYLTSCISEDDTQTENTDDTDTIVFPGFSKDTQTDTDGTETSSDGYAITYKGFYINTDHLASSYTDSDLPLKLDAPTADGPFFRFAGWLSGKEMITEIADGTTGDLELYAILLPTALGMAIFLCAVFGVFFLVFLFITIHLLTKYKIKKPL